MLNIFDGGTAPADPRCDAPFVAELRVGRVADLGRIRTGYAKSPVPETHAHELGLDGDEQGNRRVHGGPEKAVYAYALANYAAWAAEEPRHAAKLVPGGFGENLVIAGLHESKVHIGDRWRVGDAETGALLEACQPRNPCATLGAWFGDQGMVRRFLERRRSGWYCRVIRPGRIAAGDPLTLERRLDGAWTIARLLAVADSADPTLLDIAATHERLATEWSIGLAKEAAAMRRRAAKAAAA